MGQKEKIKKRRKAKKYNEKLGVRKRDVGNQTERNETVSHNKQMHVQG